MLHERIALYDVRDVEQFVQACVNRSRRRYAPDERDELVAAGLLIACDLAAKFEPHRAGYEQPGRFSGYLARFLPLKLEDAYHRMHPEHVLKTQADGKRKHEYRDKPVSLQALMGDDPDSQSLLDTVDQPTAHILAMRVYPLLLAAWTARIKVWCMMAAMFAEGATEADVAEKLECTRADVRQGREALKEVWER